MLKIFAERKQGIFVGLDSGCIKLYGGDLDGKVSRESGDGKVSSLLKVIMCMFQEFAVYYKRVNKSAVIVAAELVNKSAVIVTAELPSVAH